MLAGSLLWTAASVWLVRALGTGAQALQLSLLFAILLVVSLVDMRERRIPNACIACACGVRALYLLHVLGSGHAQASALARESLAGMLMGLAPLVVAVLLLSRGGAAMSVGGGDIKLVAALGLYLGPSRVLPMLALGCLLMLAMALVSGRRRDDASLLQLRLPFGPPLALSGCVLLLAGV